jgi:membrane associated rhomboid family serine protease/Zn-finger nucleic acid-binding protein
VQEQTPSGRIEVDYCPQCRGIFFDQGELEALLQQGGSAALFGPGALFAQAPAGSGEHRSRIGCPRHRHIAMTELAMTGARGSALSAAAGAVGPGELRIDRCPRCAGIWLDGGELAALTQALREPGAHPLLVPQPPAGVATSTSSPWLWLFMFLTGLPVETWQSRARRPQAVLVILVLCCAVFGLQALDGAGAGAASDRLAAFALVPARLWRGDYLPLLTHMFLHGGIGHLLGNMYFLWIFGDNVEDRLGSAYFLFLYLVSGLGAALLHCLLTTDPALPVVGASGAISGVMAAYALLFPQARLVSLIFIFQVRWKTTTYLLLWLALQFVGALWGQSHVAWWAHIGGFLVGAALVWNKRPTAVRRREPVAAAWPPVDVTKTPAASREPPPNYWK